MTTEWPHGWVRDGKIVLDEPLDLPDGTEIELYLDDGGLSDAELEKVMAAKQARRSEAKT